MKVQLLNVNGGSYVNIITSGSDLSIRLDQSLPAGASMRITAKELREKAHKMIQRANLIEDASYNF